MSGDVKHLAEDMAELSDAFGVIDFVPQLVHHANLDELAELADDWLPESVHLYCLDALQAAPILATFDLFGVVGRRFKLCCPQTGWRFVLWPWILWARVLSGAAAALTPHAGFFLSLRVEKLVWIGHERGHRLGLTTLAQHGSGVPV